MGPIELDQPLQAEALREIECSLYGKLRAHHLSEAFIERCGEDALQKGLIEYFRAVKDGRQIDNRDAFVVKAKAPAPRAMAPVAEAARKSRRLAAASFAGCRMTSTPFDATARPVDLMEPRSTRSSTAAAWPPRRPRKSLSSTWRQRSCAGR